MATLTLTPWEIYPHAAMSNALANGVRVYALSIYTRAPEKPEIMRDKPHRCRKDHAVNIACFIAADVCMGSLHFSLPDAAIYLAQLGLTDDLENFFQAATDMGWEDKMVLEARRAANAFIGPPPSPAYLVIRLLSGVLEYEYLPTMAEAQQAVADHCGVETTDLQSTAGIPWGAVFSATNGDKYDAWAFPVHDSGENIADLSARVETVSQHRWQLWEAFHTAAARLRIHGLEVPGVDPLPGTGCPFCGSQRAVTKNDGVFAEASPVLECQDCKSIWSSTCPECGSTDITHTWILDRSPSGYVRRQILVWKCVSCEHAWDWDEEIVEHDSATFDSALLQATLPIAEQHEEPEEEEEG